MLCTGINKKMLTGHAFSRALQAHTLSFTAIGINICRMVDLTSEHKEFIYNFLGQWSIEPAILSDCEPPIACATTNFVQTLTVLENHGPTAQLHYCSIKN